MIKLCTFLESFRLDKQDILTLPFFPSQFHHNLILDMVSPLWRDFSSEGVLDYVVGTYQALNLVEARHFQWFWKEH